MNKVLTLLFAALASVMLTACDDGDSYFGPGHPGSQGGGNELNRYESELVGSYVSDDDPTSLFYLVLNDNLTGHFETVKNGMPRTERFEWEAEKNVLRVYYDDGTRSDMDYYFRRGHLYVDGISLVENTSGTGYTPLVGQWQWKDDNYYYDVWGVPDGSYFTVMEFFPNGEGLQLDYDVAAPFNNYAFTPFLWVVDGSNINLTYADDSGLGNAVVAAPVFRGGTMTYTYRVAGRSFNLCANAIYGFDWAPYRGAYGQNSPKKAFGAIEMKAVGKGVFRK